MRRLLKFNFNFKALFLCFALLLAGCGDDVDPAIDARMQGAKPAELYLMIDEAQKEKKYKTVLRICDYLIVNYADDVNRLRGNILRAHIIYDLGDYTHAKAHANATLEAWPNCADADKKDMQELIDKCETMEKVEIGLVSGSLALSIAVNVLKYLV